MQETEDSTANTNKDVDALYKCEPVHWKNKLSKPMRMIAGYVVALLFVSSFVGIVWLSVFILLPCFYFTKFTLFLSSACVGILVASMLKEWPLFRVVGQLFYELFSVSTNDFRSSGRRKIVEMGTTGDDAVNSLSSQLTRTEYFRFNLYCGPHTAINTLQSTAKGISEPANAAGRTPRHLNILPGRVAEIHTSMPGRNDIVFNNRHGIIRLSLETGAAIIPSYVCGGTDFFHNLSTDPRFKVIAALSRKLKMGLTLFRGPFYLPVLGESCPQAMIDELHGKVLQEIQRIFDQYKKAAGQPDAVLEVV